MASFWLHWISQISSAIAQIRLSASPLSAITKNGCCWTTGGKTAGTYFDLVWENNSLPILHLGITQLRRFDRLIRPHNLDEGGRGQSLYQSSKAYLQAMDKAGPWRRKGKEEERHGGFRSALLAQPSLPLPLLLFSAEDLTFYFIRKIEAKLTSLLT